MNKARLGFRFNSRGRQFRICEHKISKEKSDRTHGVNGRANRLLSCNLPWRVSTSEKITEKHFGNRE
jgi:hypothetical protein